MPTVAPGASIPPVGPDGIAGKPGKRNAGGMERYAVQVVEPAGGSAEAGRADLPVHGFTKKGG